MYKNFNISDEERKQIMEQHESVGYKQPISESRTKFFPSFDQLMQKELRRRSKSGESTRYDDLEHAVWKEISDRELASGVINQDVYDRRMARLEKKKKESKPWDEPESDITWASE